MPHRTLSAFNGMRLINTSTYEIEEKIGSRIPEYAILSHTWEYGQEVSYEDYVNGRSVETTGYRKIVKLCEFARSRGIGWAWCDSCCIDKTSSAEVSEAINSMFVWYSRAKVCFVFLQDLNSVEREGSSGFTYPGLADCKWFRRGWTLQELLAPSNCLFYDRNYNLVGTKASLANELTQITRIERDYLLTPLAFRNASVAHRMSWMADRETTREEDIAYCMLQIFDVNMPLLYGEGRRAFRRLQREIIAQLDDDSIFAWLTDSSDVDGAHTGMLANSPRDFRHCADVCCIDSCDSRSPSVVDRRYISIPYSASSWVELLHETLSCPWPMGDSNRSRLTTALRCVSGPDSRRIALDLERDTRGLWHRQTSSQRTYCNNRLEPLLERFSLLRGKTICLAQQNALPASSQRIKPMPPESTVSHTIRTWCWMMVWVISSIIFSKGLVMAQNEPWVVFTCAMTFWLSNGNSYCLIFPVIVANLVKDFSWVYFFALPISMAVAMTPETIFVD